MVATTTSKQQRQQSSHITIHCSKTGTSELLAVLEIATDSEKIKAFCHRFCMMEARFALRAQLRSLQMAILWKCDDNKQICYITKRFSEIVPQSFGSSCPNYSRRHEPCAFARTNSQERMFCMFESCIASGFSTESFRSSFFTIFLTKCFLRCSCDLI